MAAPGRNVNSSVTAAQRRRDPVRRFRFAVAVAVLAGVCLVVGAVSAGASAVVKTIPVGYNPQGVSSDGTHVWVANDASHTVSEIDAASGTVVNTIKLPTVSDGSSNDPWAVSSDGTDVWVLNETDLPVNHTQEFGGSVIEIDAASGTVVKTIPVGDEPTDISSDGTHVWATSAPRTPKGAWARGTVSEIDASTGTVVKTIKAGGCLLYTSRCV